MTSRARGNASHATNGDERRIARWLIALALLLFCWTHRHAFSLTGFADDLGLLSDLPQRAASGELLRDVVAKWSAPLWPSSTMWRPWAYASFAIDAAVWGYAPGLWRLTNLLLHVATAILTGLVTQRLLAQRYGLPGKYSLAAAAAFSVFLLAPLGPEVTLWLVGRFDGWATFGIALAAWTALRSRGPDRWFTLSLAAGFIALASKESAMLLPVWCLLIAFFQRVGSDHDRSGDDPLPALPWTLVLAQIALAVSVFMWRSHVLDGAAITVYGQAPVSTLTDLLSRFFVHLGFIHGLVPLTRTAATVTMLCAVVLVAIALARARGVALLGLALSGLVVAAIAVYFAAPPDAHDGYRLYYLAIFGASIAVGAAFRDTGRSPRLTAQSLLLGLVIASAVWQYRVTAEWTRASREISHAVTATRSTLATLPAGDYGLLLLPDSMGRVPMLRNAQGVLLPLVASSHRRMLDHLVIFTPPQFAEWQKLMQEDVVPKLTTRADAPARPTRYFCHSTNSETLIDLGYWYAGAPDWEKRWRQAGARCSF